MALTTSLTTLASKATPRNGFGGASVVWPALSSSRITPANPDASAKAPWTRTTVGPGMGTPQDCRDGPNDVTSPDPSEPAQGCAARHVTGCYVPLNRHATTTCKRYRVGREAAPGLGQALGPRPPTRLPIANVHADRRTIMCMSNVLYSATPGAAFLRVCGWQCQAGHSTPSAARNLTSDTGGGPRAARHAGGSMAGLTSTTGVPSIASKASTSTPSPSRATMRARCRPMGLGRLGEQVLNTPVNGWLRSPWG